jgi:hypothetical protein
MNTIKKIKNLLECGMKPKTLLGLTDNQINILHKRMVEQSTKTVVPKEDKAKINQLMSQKKSFEVYEQDDDENLTRSDSFGSRMLSKNTGQSLPHMSADMAPDGMDDDSDYDRYMMKDSEMKEGKKKTNPWAICTAQLGKEFGTTERSEWTKSQMKKYEACVMDVKSQDKKKKSEKSLDEMIESRILAIVENSLTIMTKRDILNLIEMKMSDTETPTKPREKTREKDVQKPKTPTRPKHKPRPKMEFGEDFEFAEPAVVPKQPKTSPGVKPTTKPGAPERKTPTRPKHKPRPKMGDETLPTWLSFDNLGIKFKK